VRREADAACTGDVGFQRFVFGGHVPSLHGAEDETTLPVPLQMGHFDITVPSPTLPVPRQFMQSVEGAGPGLTCAMSEYLPATATNGRRSSVALEQPQSMATSMRMHLYIASGSISRVLATRPAGNA
jgi:hypothetical protein